MNLESVSSFSAMANFSQLMCNVKLFLVKVIAAKGPWYVFYFVFVIFLGPFYLINLVLAVVSLSYEQETAALQDETLRVSEHLKLDT